MLAGSNPRISLHSLLYIDTNAISNVSWTVKLYDCLFAHDDNSNWYKILLPMFELCRFGAGRLLQDRNLSMLATIKRKPYNQCFYSCRFGAGRLLQQVRTTASEARRVDAVQRQTESQQDGILRPHRGTGEESVPLWGGVQSQVMQLRDPFEEMFNLRMKRVVSFQGEVQSRVVQRPLAFRGGVHSDDTWKENILIFPDLSLMKSIYFILFPDLSKWRVYYYY